MTRARETSESARQAKAWVNFQGNTPGRTAGSSVTIRKSFNVSSVTWHNTGDFSVNFEDSMDSSDYCVIAYGNGPADPGVHVLPFTNYIRNNYSANSVAVAWFATTNSNTRADPTYGWVVVYDE